MESVSETQINHICFLLTWKSTLHSKPFPFRFLFQDSRWELFYLFIYLLIHIFANSAHLVDKNAKQRNRTANHFSQKINKSGPKKTPESLVASILKTGNECFLRVALWNHRRRGRGGHGEVGADVISRLAPGGEEEDNLNWFHSRKSCIITAAKTIQCKESRQFYSPKKGIKWQMKHM